MSYGRETMKKVWKIWMYALGSFNDEDTREYDNYVTCLLYTSPSPRDKRQSRMPSSA